jgi:hypothetical protein
MSTKRGLQCLEIRDTARMTSPSRMALRHGRGLISKVERFRYAKGGCAHQRLAAGSPNEVNGAPEKRHPALRAANPASLANLVAKVARYNHAMHHLPRYLGRQRMIEREGDTSTTSRCLIQALPQLST